MEKGILYHQHSKLTYRRATTKEIIRKYVYTYIHLF